ncbi:MAG: hypothetical protein ACXWJB_04010 [Limisphaerales bacterium]
MNAQLPTEQPAPKLAEKIVRALSSLAIECKPHSCGGFTLDDIRWRMGTPFISDESLYESMDEVLEARLIRYVGYDDEAAEGCCYEFVKIGGAS